MSDEKISVDIKTIQSIKSKLKELKDLNPSDELLKKINELYEFVDSKLSPSNNSLEDRIYAKMKEIKSVDPDAHLNLYMLHRRLTSGKISEEDAAKLFDAYCGNIHYDTFI